MSELLQCMDNTARQDYATVMGALAQKEMGKSPALTAYMQNMGMLSPDNVRITACENFGCEDDGASGELAHNARSSMSRLDAIHSRVEDAADRTDRDLDALTNELAQAKEKKRHINAAGIAAVLAVAHVGISTTRSIWGLMSARRADKKTLATLVSKKSQLMSAFTDAKTKFKAGQMSMDGLATAQENAVKARNETRALLTSMKSTVSPMKLLTEHPGASMASTVVVLGCYFVLYWILTKIVLAAVHLVFGHMDHGSHDASA